MAMDNTQCMQPVSMEFLFMMELIKETSQV